MEGDVVGAARRLEELVVVAPAGDAEDAERLAREAGGRWAALTGPSSIPEVFAELLGT